MQCNRNCPASCRQLKRYPERDLIDVQRGVAAAAARATRGLFPIADNRCPSGRPVYEVYDRRAGIHRQILVHGTGRLPLPVLSV